MLNASALLSLHHLFHPVLSLVWVTPPGSSRLSTWWQYHSSAVTRNYSRGLPCIFQMRSAKTSFINTSEFSTEVFAFFWNKAIQKYKTSYKPGNNTFISIELLSGAFLIFLSLLKSWQGIISPLLLTGFRNWETTSQSIEDSNIIYYQKVWSQVELNRRQTWQYKHLITAFPRRSSKLCGGGQGDLNKWKYIWCFSF